MTHYMELLATAQPWNLIKFMAVPVVLAEALVAIEFFIVFNREYQGTLRSISKVLGIAFGIWFLGIFVYLMTTAIPGMPWRGWVDVVAVGFYLSGVIPAAGIALMEFGLVGKKLTPEQKMKAHFILLTVFLVVAHIAMIFGMVNPELIMGSGSAKMPM
ncbi:MAG: DUF6803 family protein [Methylocystaceae bacterium]